MSNINPDHYKKGKFELIEIIEAWNLNFYRANVIKYVARAGYKCLATELEDLKKAQWYLNREIAKLENEELKEVYKEAKEKAKKLDLSGGQFVCSKCKELIPFADSICVDGHGGYLCGRC